MEQRRETAFPKAGILPAPYHGNRYSIPDYPVQNARIFFASVSLYFFTYCRASTAAPPAASSCAAEMRWGSGTPATDSSTRSIVAAYALGHAGGAVQPADEHGGRCPWRCAGTPSPTNCRYGSRLAASITPSEAANTHCISTPKGAEPSRLLRCAAPNSTPDTRQAFHTPARAVP